MNKELFLTLREELKRLAAEGEEFVALDESSERALKALAASCAPELSGARRQSQKIPASEPSGARLKTISIPSERRRPAEDEETLDSSTLSEIRFADKIEISTAADPANPPEKRKLKIMRQIPEPGPSSEIPKPVPFSIPEGGKRERWEFLKNLVLSDAVCNAHVKPGKKVVFGVGNLDAKIFFCGEAPGADEEIQGEPFVGRAGQLLTKIIGAMGLSRGDVYIGNIMNWRPEVPRGNRPPTQEEMEYCLPYLKAQIEIVNPQIVVALGMTAVHGLLGYDPMRRMGKVRGKWTTFDGRDLMITYHPSFLLQYASAAMKRLVWEDMMAVMERAGIPISEKQRGYYAHAKQ